MILDLNGGTKVKLLLGGQGGVWSLEGGQFSTILEVCREEDSVYKLFGVFREGLVFGGGQCIIIFISVIVLNVFFRLIP